MWESTHRVSRINACVRLRRCAQASARIVTARSRACAPALAHDSRHKHARVLCLCARISAARPQRENKQRDKTKLYL